MLFGNVLFPLFQFVVIDQIERFLHMKRPRLHGLGELQLLTLMDEGRIAFSVGVELSYLSANEQHAVADAHG